MRNDYAITGRRAGVIKPQLSIRVVDSVKSWKSMLEDLLGTVSFDIETTGLYPWAKRIEGFKAKKGDPRLYDARVVSVGFGTRRHQWLIPTHAFQLNQRRIRELEKALEDCTVVAHNGKFDALWMRVHFNMRVRIDFDTMIAHYMADENSFHDLKGLAQRFCNAPEWDVGLEKKKEWSDTLIRYHAHDLYYTRLLKPIFGTMLDADPKVKQVFDKIMMPCVGIFVEAEYEGIFLDISRMGEVEAILRKQIRKAEKELSKYGDILWSSPAQLAELLFKKLKLPVIERTKTGKPSTSESVLKRLDHPMVKALLNFRGAKQQLSFFIEGWQAFIVNGRLHPSFKLIGTVTGRLSCEHPNLQQVPRDPQIRSLIIAPKGWVLVEADLSQIELRIAAELSGDRALVEAFLTGKDPHWITALNELRRGEGEYERVIRTAKKIKKFDGDYDTAIEILLAAGADACIEIDYAWKELRKKAKAVNFGYLYGMGWRKFKDYARDKYDVILDDNEAQESRESFFELYADLPKWHRRQRTFAHNTGYVRSLSGRKRRLPDAMLDNEKDFARQEAERQAINSPVQSFANELNLMAIVQLTREFGRDVYRPVGTVHDSILAYVREDMVDIVARRTLEIMRHPKLLDVFDIDLRIPIESEVSIGPWGKSKKYHPANDNVKEKRRAA